MVANGYDVEGLEQPYFISRGQWTVSGNTTIDAFTLLKPTKVLVSGAFGISGIYYTRSLAEPYDDISGVSGAMGCTIRKIYADTETGNVVHPIYRRSMGVCHEGYVRMRYESGTLDGAVVTLTYGDLISPCVSGFRVYEPYALQTDADGSGFVTTGTAGIQQQILGWYADVASASTGTWKRIKLMPHGISGMHVL